MAGLGLVQTRWDPWWIRSRARDPWGIRARARDPWWDPSGRGLGWDSVTPGPDWVGHALRSVLGILLFRVHCAPYQPCPSLDCLGVCDNLHCFECEALGGQKGRGDVAQQALEVGHYGSLAVQGVGARAGSIVRVRGMIYDSSR